MGQQEVVEYLKENPGKWFDTHQLAKALNVNSSSINRVVRRLRLERFVSYKENLTFDNHKMYLYKHRE